MAEINGTDGDDVLDGTSGNDIINGLAGNDIINAGSGNDTVNGGLGNDRVDAGAGDDVVVFVLGGSVSADGGTGIDTFDLSAADGRVAFNANGTGITVIGFNTSIGTQFNFEQVIGGRFNDTFYDFFDDSLSFFDGGDGVDRVDYGRIGTGINVNLQIGVGSGGAAEGDIYQNIEVIDATDSNDVFVGRNGQINGFFGYDGNDRATGGDQSDTLFGDKGNDTLIGNDGNDTLNGGRGLDSLVGGNGDDRLVNAENFGDQVNDTLDGGAGNDTAELRNIAVDIDLQAGTSVGVTLISIENIVLAGFSAYGTIRGDNNDNRFFSSAGSDIFFGRGGNDLLSDIGRGIGDGDDYFDGGTGNDTLVGELGDDTLIGGAGDDLIESDTFNSQDTLIFEGTHGNDTLLNVDRSDIVDLSGTITVFNTRSDVQNAAREAVVDDVAGVLINTGGGNSIFLVGAVLSDISTLSFVLADGSVSANLGQGVEGGQGDATNFNDILSIGFGDFIGDPLLQGLEGNDTLFTTSEFGGIGSRFFATLEGGSGNDLLRDQTSTSDAGQSVLRGGEGNDTLIGNGGRDTLEGGPGADLINFGGFNREVPGGDVVTYRSSNEGVTVNLFTGEASGGDAEGDEFVDVGIGRVELEGSDFADDLSAPIVLAGAGNDTLRGNESFLDGGDGNDLFVNSTTSDDLMGGAGSDIFVFENGHGNDIIRDLQVSDVIDFSALTVGLVNLEAVRAAAEENRFDLTITTGDNSSLTLRGIGLSDLVASNFIFEGQTEPGVQGSNVSPNEADGATDGADSLEGEDGNDALDGEGGNDTLRGNDGNDTLEGGGGSDFVVGGAGDDLASGGLGNDQIFAGPNDLGNDTVVGGDGRDTLGGGAGNDFVVGDGAGNIAGLETGSTGLDGNDVLFGGSGNDTLLGGGFADTNGNDRYDAGEEVITGTSPNAIFAGTGNDRIAGAAGNDTIGGGAGDDTLRGGSGDDIFYGGRGDGGDTGRNDVISAGNGDDIVFAGAGNDDVDGGLGNDELFNGAGNDTVRGNSGNDTLFGGAGDDRLSGNSGADTFAFFEGNGDDTIVAFNTSEDVLDLAGTATDFTDLASVEAAASNAAQGGVLGLLIDTGTGDSIFLEGLSVSDLPSIDIIF